jgi:hypothetical protein
MLGAVVEPGGAITQVLAAPPTAKRGAGRQFLADLAATVSQFRKEKHGSRLVAAFVADNGDAGCATAGVEFDTNRL